MSYNSTITCFREILCKHVFIAYCCFGFSYICLLLTSCTHVKQWKHMETFFLLLFGLITNICLYCLKRYDQIYIIRLIDENDCNDFYVMFEVFYMPYN